jgi:hypothetical protein
MLTLTRPAAVIAPAFTLDVTKVATIASFEGPKSRYYVRNFTLVAVIAL